MRGNTEEFIDGASDFRVLDYLKTRKDFADENLKRCQNLHMKAYLIDDTMLLITSGNMTRPGIFANGNVEGTILTDERDVIRDFQRYFQAIWQTGQDMDNFYAQIERKLLENITKRQPSLKAHREAHHHQFDVRGSNPKQSPQPKSTKLMKFGDIPFRNGRFSDILPTLEHLSQREYMSYYELGYALRYVKPHLAENDRPTKNESKETTNNKKVGEERAKTAMAFGLTTITPTNDGMEVRITNLGKCYLRSDNASQMAILYHYLKDMPYIEMLRTHFSDGAIEHLDDASYKNQFIQFLYTHIEGSNKTIDRIVPITKKCLQLTVRYEQSTNSVAD